MTTHQTINGIQCVATIKPGWLGCLSGAHAVLTAPTHPPYRVALDSIVEGDELPRATDQPIAGW